MTSIYPTTIDARRLPPGPDSPAPDAKYEDALSTAGHLPGYQSPEHRAIAAQSQWIVCLGGEDWWYHSHAHFDIQLMKRFARHQPVLYVCTTGMRIPSMKRGRSLAARILRKIRSAARSLQQIHNNLYVYSPVSIPAYHHVCGQAANRALVASQLAWIYNRLGIRYPLLWVNTPTAYPAARRLANRGLIYQRTDDYAAYALDNFNTDYVRSIDEQLVCTADLVLHVSERLHQRDAGRARHCLLLEQGVDERFFERNGHTCPHDLAALPRPVAGYVGNLEPYKFDTTLVQAVARQLPGTTFALIGPDHPNAAPLKKLPNVRFLGRKPHKSMPCYVRNFDVCMLPAARTDWNMSSNPIKLMEYLATGRPVVATRTPASERFSGTVNIGDTAEQWVQMIRSILCQQTATPDTKRCRPHLVTWDEQVTRIRTAMCESGLYANRHGEPLVGSTRVHPTYKDIDVPAACPGHWRTSATK